MKHNAIPLLVLLLLCATAAAETDLAGTYPATLGVSKEPLGLSWVTTPADVWRLSSFEYSGPGEISLETGPATLVIGRNGTDALLAVLRPDEPGTLVSKENGEEAARVAYLRFHPSKVGELFPAGTVEGPGTAGALLEARRIIAAKIGNSFQIDGLPVVPAARLAVVDADLVDGTRRFHLLDGKAGTNRYVAAFSGRRTPPARTEPVDAEAALAAFDAVWKAVDEEYAMFGLRPDLDWSAARETYRPVAAAAKTKEEAATAFALLLAELRDLHAWVKLGEEYLPVWQRYRPLNANGRVTQGLAGGPEPHGPDLSATVSTLGIGYIGIWRLSDPALPDHFDIALQEMKETKALIIDLRFNQGGDEALAQRIAGRFAAEETVYSSAHWRNGPGHDDLSEAIPRKISPRGDWRYDKPVVVLQSRKTMSSAESFVAMLSVCPGVTTMGAPTAGSSGNPKVLEPIPGVSVAIPRWLDLGPGGEPLDGEGIAPDIEVPCPLSELRKSDPVMLRAITWIRERTK